MGGPLHACRTFDGNERRLRSRDRRRSDDRPSGLGALRRVRWAFGRIRGAAKMTVVVERRRDGLAFHVIARAGGRKNEVRGEHDGALRVSVTAAPEKGK